MKKGEVWRVRLPAVPGHTQSGERPAIIVQDQSSGNSLPTVLIIPFTSNQRTTRFPATVLVQPDSNNGLTVTSVALVFQLSALDRRNCVARLGELDLPTLEQIYKALDDLMGR